ncbi:MAG: ATP-binding protein [Trueperaceae bacterium]|nr:ATP-binding protein [Trueperaceae bacterium]
MKLVVRLVVAFAVVAALSVAITSLLSYRAAVDRIPRALAQPGVMQPGVMRGAGPPDGAGLGARGQQVLTDQLREANLRAALLALGIALVVGGGVAVGVTRPLERLTTVARRYGQGERDLRARLRGADELAALGRVFDETADRLQAEQDLKQRFTTDVAHELRTPLTVLRSELEAIQDGLMEPDPERIDALLEQVDLLARLVHDLRTLTLAEAGELALRRTSLDLAELARGTADAFRSSAATRHVRIEVEARPVQIHADADRLRQVTGNLLANALHHARPGGRVRLSVGAADGHGGTGATLVVEDDGPGIAAEQLPNVFERFYRVDPARSRSEGGSGLGLAIVRALVELHGGTVRVETADPSRSGELGGARFVVELPG